MLDSFQGAIDELSWRYHRAASAIGVRGQSIGEGGGSASVWDEAASNRAHLSRRGDAFRHAVQKMAKIDRTLATIPSNFQRTIANAFEPYGRVSNRLATVFSVSTTDDPKVAKLPLIGLVVHTHAARVAFAKAHDTVVCPGTEFLLRWLEAKAEKPGGAATRAFEWMKREAAGVLYLALRPYEEARQARLAEERTMRQEFSALRAAELDAELDSKHERERLRAQLRIEGTHAGMLDNLRALLERREGRAIAETEAEVEAGADPEEPISEGAAE